MSKDDDASAQREQEQSERLTAHAKWWAKEFQANAGLDLDSYAEGQLEDCFRRCVEKWIGEGRQQPRSEAIQELLERFAKRRG